MISIQAIVENAARQAGCELYDLIVVNARNEKHIRVFIDKVPAVGIDDCATVSRILNEEFEKDGSLSEFNLEVSSPGLERELKTLKHFSSVIEKKVQFKISKTVAELGYKGINYSNAKNFSAIVKGIDQEKYVSVLIDQETVMIPINLISKANLIFDFEKPKSKKGSR